LKQPKSFSTQVVKTTVARLLVEAGGVESIE